MARHINEPVTEEKTWIARQQGVTEKFASWWTRYFREICKLGIHGRHLSVVRLLIFFSVYNGVKERNAISRNCALSFELWSFPRLVISPMILTCDARQWEWAAAPSQPCDHKGKQPICLQAFWIQTSILLFTCSIVFNKIHEISSTLL